MNENLTSNNIESDDFILNAQNSDYMKLISRLREITSTIALLEKKLSR